MQENGVQDLARRMSPAKDRRIEMLTVQRGTVATGGDRKTDVDNRVGKGSMEPQTCRPGALGGIGVQISTAPPFLFLVAAACRGHPHR